MKKVFVYLMVFCAIAVFSQDSFAKKYTTADAISKAVKITDDNFKKQTVYEFPIIDYQKVDKKEKLQYIPDYKDPNLFFKNNPLVYQIVAIVNQKTGEKTFYLKFSFYFDAGAGFYVEQIYDSNGNQIYKGFSNFEDADANHSFISTYLFEGIAKVNKTIFYCNPTVTEQYLKDNKDTGIVLKVYAPKEDVYLHIPSYYIQAVLDTVK